MDNPLSAIPSVWLDWIAVFSYIGLAAFVTWRVVK